MTIVTLNGVEVTQTYLVLNLVWNALVLFVAWPLVGLNLSRLGSIYKRRPLKRRRARVHWTLVTANTVLATITFDPLMIYFDETMYFRHFSLTEFILVSLDLAIYYFFSHVEAYIIAEGSRLQVPKWIPTVKWRWMIANAIVGNIMVFALVALNRSFLSGLLHIYLAIQLLILGSTLMFTAHRVNRLFEAAYASASTISGPMRSNMKKFRRFATISSSVMLFVGVFFAARNVPRFFIDPSLKATDDPRWNRTARDSFDISEVLGVWTTIPILFYFIFVFWLPRPPTNAGAGSGSGPGRPPHGSSGTGHAANGLLRQNHTPLPTGSTTSVTNSSTSSPRPDIPRAFVNANNVSMASSSPMENVGPQVACVPRTLTISSIDENLGASSPHRHPFLRLDSRDIVSNSVETNDSSLEMVDFNMEIGGHREKSYTLV